MLRDQMPDDAQADQDGPNKEYEDPLDPETRAIFERSLRRNRKALERLAEL